MFKLRFATLAGTALALATSVAGAQGRRAAIPRGQMPPAGLCRVWIDGVPPGHQPRATDCATARINAPANSRIVFGGQSLGRVRLDPRVDRSGQYDPRADPRSPSYDPRYDPNSRLYDPRYGTNRNGTYDPRHEGTNGNDDVNDPRHGRNGSYGVYDPRHGTNGNGTYDSRRNGRERDRWDRSREREHGNDERNNERRSNSDGEGDDPGSR